MHEIYVQRTLEYSKAYVKLIHFAIFLLGISLTESYFVHKLVTSSRPRLTGTVAKLAVVHQG